MKTTILIASLLSALLFASLHTLPDVEPHSSPKAFASGMVALPRILGLLLCAAIAAVLGFLHIRRHGVRRTFRHPTLWASLLLLLPAAYTFVFAVRFILAVQ